MPVFTYKAYNAAGQLKSGIADADTLRDARLKLRRDGLMVTDIEVIEEMDQGQRMSLGSWWRNMRTRSKAKQDLPQITRQIATLLGSGIPLNDTLRAMVEQIEEPRLEAVFRNVRERITQGASLAEGIEQHPAVFPPLYVSMVRAGEAAGNTDVVLERLASFLLKQAHTKNQVLAALMYPIVMVVIGAIVVTVLMIKVVPKLIVLVEAKGGVLPGPTLALKALSDFLTSYWYLIALAFVLVYIGWSSLRRSDKGRYTTDKLQLGLPVFGDLFKKQAISRFAVTLSTLLKTGVPILEAIQIVRNVVGNAVLEKVLDDLHSAIMKGADISTPLKRSGIFPPAVGYMISVGEQSGELETVLDRLAESYEQEVEISTEKMTRLLEPILIVLMAGAVGFIVMAIVLPMLQLGQM